jgi:hypothetical protein
VAELPFRKLELHFCVLQVLKHLESLALEYTSAKKRARSIDSSKGNRTSRAVPIFFPWKQVVFASSSIFCLELLHLR